jgi:hypothetical protein
VLQFQQPMKRANRLLLYQDEPAYGALLKLIIVIVPALLLAASAYLWSTGESTGGLALLAESLFIGFLFWVIFPRRYQVYEDRLRIALGGPFAVEIGFDQIKVVEVTSRNSLTVNFTTAVTRTYVRIVKKRGLSIAITPRGRDLFVENADRAMTEWVRTRPTTGG